MSSSGPPPPADDGARGPPRRSATQPFDTGAQQWSPLNSPISRATDLFGDRALPTPLESDGASDAFGPLSPGAHDRVFPIRSVVSVDPTQTPRSEATTDAFPGIGSDTQSNYASRRYSSTSVGTTSSRFPETGGGGGGGGSRGPRDRNPSHPRDEERRGRSTTVDTQPRAADTFVPWHSQAPDDNSVRSSSLGRASSPGADKGKPPSLKSFDDVGTGILTARFKHVTTEDGHAVITGRDGDALQRCEDEPIHIPGAVQSFGLLMAVAEKSDSKLEVRIVSENSKDIIGYTPKQLFDLDSFTDILSEEQTDNLLDHIEFIRESDGDIEMDGPEVFTLSIRHPQNRRSTKLWCAAHANVSNGDLVILEFELEDDIKNPLMPSNEGTPDLPEDTLSSNPTDEELAESTLNISKPLRVLRSARKKKSETAAMEIFNIMSQIESQLAAATKLEVFLKILIGVVKELSGFHRVMIYQFDHEFNGRVVSELVDPRATKDLYKGLNFPASDIPKQARDLYKVNKLRLLYDRDHQTARLVCRTMKDLEIPLDLTHAYLRAMSPIHIKYLGNMAVRSSMSISVNAFNELWGLIACHTYGNKGMRVSFPIRKMCRLVGDIASRNIERLSYASRLQARKLINTVPTEKNPSGYIVATSEDLLKLFDADCGVLAIRDETKILGRIENSQEALALIEYFRQRQITSVLTTQDVRVDFPDLRYAPGFSTIAGLLLVPLSTAGLDFIVFFRRPQVREVKWAGNPYEKFIRHGTEGYLEPRQSFKMWSETVVGKCREWTEEQVETAAVLCLVYGKFIEVWRQKEAAIQNTQLTKLLLANSAHEVRTPLNAIINYLEIAMEGHLDQETRDNLSRSHSASKSLIYVINDLLDLTKIEEGNQVVKDDVFDLPETVREATDPFINDAKRKQILYEVTQNPGVPQLVVGDQRRVRQAISNVVANAIQYTSTGSVNVELWLASEVNNRVEIDIVVRDTGVGMSPSKLDEIFRELEQVQSEASELQDMMAPDPTKLTDKKEKSIGYGLALVGRIVRNMNGSLRLKSEEGIGSRFVIQFAFTLPELSKKTIEGPVESRPPSSHAVPPVTEGEVVLVDKAASRSRSIEKPRSRRASQDSLASAKSGKSLSSLKSGSSTRSDVDRLIEAIQEPHVLERTGSTRSAKDLQSPTKTPARPTLARSNTTNSAVPTEKQGLQPALASTSQPGQTLVTDQKTPIRSIRIPGGNDEHTSASPTTNRPLSRVSFDLPPEQKPNVAVFKPEQMGILVAEDDPVNCKIMQKRLQRLGHTVTITVNGEECASMHGDHSTNYDVVLMDMQMPIVDGMTSTKMIRSFEKTHGRARLSLGAQRNARIPIFAVSASLDERRRQEYMDAGFDGWILKPVDFNRLSKLFKGIADRSLRNECVYQPGEWERGGWFEAQSPDLYSAVTSPNPDAAASNLHGFTSYPPHGSDDPHDDRISREQQRLDSLKGDAVSDPSRPTSE